MPDPIAQPQLTPPLPGQYWPEQAGWYIGIICNPANGQAWHLIQPKGDEYIFPSIAWGKEGKSVEGADSVYDGHANTLAMLDAGSTLARKIRALPGDCHLPSRAESLAMFAVAKEHQTGGWHWTSTQYSGLTAWIQLFYYGSQLLNDKGSEARARAVRRLILQPFSSLASSGGAA